MLRPTARLLARAFSPSSSSTALRAAALQCRAMSTGTAGGLPVEVGCGGERVHH